MQKIKFLVMDVDGTLTDGKIYMGSGGELFKAFNVKDGYGITSILPSMNILPIIITGRNSTIVENRCKELGISEVYQNSKDKLCTLCDALKKYNSEMDCVAYIGDDIPDYACMQEVKKAGGLVMCPLDATSEITTISDYVSEKLAGDGAVRDCIEYLYRNESDRLSDSQMNMN